jgi:hypothetical protein
MDLKRVLVWRCGCLVALIRGNPSGQSLAENLMAAPSEDRLAAGSSKHDAHQQSPARAAAFAVCLAMMPAQAAEPCISDAELLAVMQDGWLRGISAAVHVCARRFPELKDQALRSQVAFESVYMAEIAAVDRESVATFERLHPGRGPAAREENASALADPARQRAERSSRDACARGIARVDAAAKANDFDSMVTQHVLRVFPEERKHHKSCTQ